MPDEPKGFQVRDRRISAQEEDSERDEEPSQGQDVSTEQSKSAAAAADAAARDDSGGTHLPKIDFATFIFSLNSSALVHMGLLEEPTTKTQMQNLPLAKQTIDILAMLEAKTRGNLTEDEERMLKNILYDLRILYVKEKK
ncbi:MAG: DUF1844 domain-containing protein [Desulfobacteraceae bacterium]|jgi:hypothetical protein|nr:DUF1844 domain-containing protein [Desulfobacteraceae bacterium]